MFLLNSLLNEEYETFVLILINGNQSLNYSNVSVAFVNYEVRRKDRKSHSNSTSAVAMMVKGRSSSQKGKDNRGRSKSKVGFKDLKKNQCAFCKELSVGRLIAQESKIRSQEPR